MQVSVELLDTAAIWQSGCPSRVRMAPTRPGLVVRSVALVVTLTSIGLPDSTASPIAAVDEAVTVSGLAGVEVDQGVEVALEVVDARRAVEGPFEREAAAGAAHDGVGVES